MGPDLADQPAHSGDGRVFHSPQVSGIALSACAGPLCANGDTGRGDPSCVSRGRSVTGWAHRAAAFGDFELCYFGLGAQGSRCNIRARIDQLRSGPGGLYSSRCW